MEMKYLLKRWFEKKHLSKTTSKKIIIHWSARMGGENSIHIEDNVKILRGVSIEGDTWIGNNTIIHDYSIISAYNGSIKIGQNCSVNPYCVLYGGGGLKIGDNVRIAAHTVMIPSNHIYDDRTIPIFLQGISTKGINIEDDVWIGAGVKILDGTKIGRGSIIGAGAVVIGEIPPFSIAVGVPAKIKKTRN